MSSNLIFGTKIGQVDLGGRWVCKTHGAGSLPALASTNKHECSSAVEHWSPKPGVGISEFSTRAKSPNSSTNRTGSYGLPDRGLIPLSDSNIQYMVSIAQRKSAPLWRERLGFRNSLGTPNTEAWQRWMIALVLKTSIPEMVSGVRIPQLPQYEKERRLLLGNLA